MHWIRAQLCVYVAWRLSILVIKSVLNDVDYKLIFEPTIHETKPNSYLFVIGLVFGTFVSYKKCVFDNTLSWMFVYSFVVALFAKFSMVIRSKVIIMCKMINCRISVYFPLKKI